MTFQELQQHTELNLLQNILPTWMRYADLVHGGFLGKVTGSNCPDYEADKGGVLNARILWTFSAAYRIYNDPLYLNFATRAKEYLLQHFFDAQYGGIYWTVNHKGEPVDTKKQIYALGFALYGLSEYARATGDEQAKSKAIELFETIEAQSFDPIEGGYFEAFARNWTELADMRLSDKDANEKKTMNTHLHILEPYTNLYRIWPNHKLGERIAHLIDLFLNKIRDPKTNHLNLFFDEKWNNKHRQVSYGHDIEASWLIHEAALVLGNAQLLKQVEPAILQIAHAAAEGIQPDGSMIYELDLTTHHADTDRHWWVQAEAIVGYINAWQLTQNPVYFHYAAQNWTYVAEKLVDHQNGEWFWSANSRGEANTQHDKLGFWKCPYHNSRMCMELIERKHSIQN